MLKQRHTFISMTLPHRLTTPASTVDVATVEYTNVLLSRRRSDVTLWRCSTSPTKLSIDRLPPDAHTMYVYPSRSTGRSMAPNADCNNNGNRPHRTMHVYV